MSTAPSFPPAVRRTRPVLYGSITLVSVLSSPIAFVWSLGLGLITVAVASTVGAASRAGAPQDRAVVALCCGLALLAGPTLYLGLALAV
jgi:hypothetical protein